MASTETYPHTCVMYRLSVGALNGNFFSIKHAKRRRKREAPLPLCICAVAFNDHRKVLYTIH